MSENEKLRFICKTDGILYWGTDLLRNEKDRNINFKLVWLLNQDFKDYLLKVKSGLEDGTIRPTAYPFFGRSLAKKAFWMAFGQVVGNEVIYSPSRLRMKELINSIYPQNKEFTDITYKMITRHLLIDKEGLEAMLENYEINLLPFYEAVNTMVNGVKS